ncbi:MAG: hypothetical protein JST92_19015 [Deltaproteobacteria bacterium]|nr:hypothetical protein [Deltaproteobacteria bacterium]
MIRSVLVSLALCACAFMLSSCRGTAPTAALGGPSQAAHADAIPSRGCALSPRLRTQQNGEQTIHRHLTSGGHVRRFVLVLPPDDSATPRPLVLNFHGLVETPGLHQALTRMDDETRKRGLVLAYPEGFGNSWNAGSCCGRGQDEQLDDVRFLRELVSQLGDELCIDLRRVYATGISNGGMISWRLACEASDVFAAIAPVAGVNVTPACAPKRNVPVLAFHGTGDFVVTPEGGRFSLPSLESTISAAESRNGCTGERTVRYKHGDTTCTSKQCPSDADVILCTIEGGGHTWPGGTAAPWLGATSTDIDATTTILDWFAQQAR